jgi:hypothetical protein
MDLSVCTDITYAATDSWSSENSWSLADNAGNVVASGANNSDIIGNAPGFDCAGNCLLDVATLELYDSYGDGWNGGFLTIDGTDYTIGTGGFAAFTLCIDLAACTDIIYTAGAYAGENAWAVTDASGAIIASAGDPSTGGGNASGDVGNGCAIFGCTDATASNFDANANTDDGSCCYDNFIAISTNLTVGVTNYPWSFNGLSWSVNAQGDPTVLGVGSGIANGYAGDAADLCLPDGCYDFVATDAFAYYPTYTVEYTIDGVTTAGLGGTFVVGTGSCLVYGCTDSTAANYDAAATTDDGSCVPACNDNWVTISCGGGSYANEVSWTLLNSAGTVVLTGGAPYSSDECLPSDCYTLNMVDSWGDGWNGNVFSLGTFGQAGLATGSAGSADISVGATCPVFGCTDPAAVNYDASANTDDGSCQYSCTAAPYCENFDLGVGTWTNNGWVNNSYGTTSGSTGPSDDITVGGFYMYYETSTGYAHSVDIT